MSDRTASRIAWVLWILTVALTAGAAALTVMTRAEPDTSGTGHWLLVLLDMPGFILAFPTVGLVLAARRPGNPRRLGTRWRAGWRWCAGAATTAPTVLASAS